MTRWNPLCLLFYTSTTLLHLHISHIVKRIGKIQELSEKVCILLKNRIFCADYSLLTAVGVEFLLISVTEMKKKT